MHQIYEYRQKFKYPCMDIVTSGKGRRVIKFLVHYLHSLKWVFSKGARIRASIMMIILIIFSLYLQSILHQSYTRPGNWTRYDRVSDVVENGVRFASKILTHNRMH